MCSTATRSSADEDFARHWRPRLEELALRIGVAARGSLTRALQAGRTDRIDRPVARGAGDLTYGIDVGSEEVLSAWLAEEAREAPLSLLTEDAGWRHRGPAAGGGVRELAGFDHGGVRICVDPIDGTRGLMVDLRPAWTVISCAPAGAGQPRLGDQRLGLLREIPDSRAAQLRQLWAVRGGGCRLSVLSVEGGAQLSEDDLRVDEDGRPDHGYFCFFSFGPELRPAIATVAARFFERLVEEEGADPRTFYDDQYISSGGLLALLAMGSHRLVVDLRKEIAERLGRASQTAKPYDIAGAILCATEAGAVLRGVDGEDLDFPIDAETPVSFVAFANEATAARCAPHLRSALAWAERGDRG